MNSDLTLEQPAQPDLNQILEAINNLQSDVDKRFERLEENLRLQFMSVDVRFDQMESIALEAKSIALMTRSHLTTLTEEARAWSREVHDLQLKV